MLVFFKYALHIKPLNALCLTHMGIYCTGMTAVGSTGTSDIFFAICFPTIRYRTFTESR